MSDPARTLPAYHELPIDPSKPPGSAWGVFGDDDDLGTINLLTPERVRAAPALPSEGRVFSLNWDVELPDAPILGRKPLEHHIIDLRPGADAYYDRFYPQASSQWDALCHMPHPHYGYCNGRAQADITGRPGSRNRIDHYARHGIVGRFVLADVARYREGIGRPLRGDEPDGVSPDDLDATLAATLAAQGVALEAGDVLLVRMGWGGWYERQAAATRRALALAGQDLKTPGLVGTEAMAAWLWDAHIAAIGCGVPALEALPSGPWNAPDPEATYDTHLHFRIIPLLGLAVGEMFVLDELADDSARDARYVGLFTAAPIHKIGGAGSPANALAVK